jgi:C4-dicarboxylate transporter DctQ subunit
MPVLVPYIVLPLSALLLVFRMFQAVGRVWSGAEESLIVSHEAEDAVENAAALNEKA